MKAMAAGTGPKSSPEVLQTLQWVRKHGFRPVPLHPASKAAIFNKYIERDYKPPADDSWHRADLGIGVVTGPKAGGPVDIDLDCEEAIFFARRLLPETPAVFGRQSKPESHYLYRVTVKEQPKIAFMDPELGNTIIEIRGDGGHQTVFPGSIHQDTKELIEWSKVPFPEVPEIDEEVLNKAVKKIAMATLIARHIWKDGQRNEVCKYLAGMYYFLDWPMDDTIQLIELVMEYHGDTDRTRRLTIVNTYRKAELGNKVVGATTLRRFMGDPKVVDKILEWAGSPTINMMQEYNERFVVVSLEGKFRIADTDVSPGSPPVFYGKDDFLNMMATDYIEIDGKNVAKGRVWLTSPRRRVAWQVDFVPGNEDTGTVLNLWSGWPLEPTEGDCSGWEELLLFICNNDIDLFRWMFNWFAGIVREPTKKPLTAPVIIGPQGAGKSLLINYFGQMLGGCYTQITNEEHIYGRFNRHLATTLLLHSEEALYGGDKRHRGIIKSLITDEFRIFEQKGVDAKQVPNYLRLILTSNELHAAPAELGDRRFTVIDMERRKAPDELIKKVLKELHSTGPAALFHKMMTFDYDPYVARTNIKNAALEALKTLNRDPVETWWYETLDSGHVLPDFLSWAQKPQEAPWPQIVSSTALYKWMVYNLKERGARNIPNEASFANQLNRMVGRKLNRGQVLFNNPMADGVPQVIHLLSARHNTIRNMPTLEECRKAYIEYRAQDVEWAEDLPEGEKPAWERKF